MPQNETDIIDMTDIFAKVNEVLNSVDLNKVTAESTGFEELQPGHYLCTVDSAVLTESKSSKNPQVKFTLTVAEDGIGTVKKDDEVLIETLKGTKGRKIFKYYPLKDATTAKRFVSDMLKFESEPGVPILPQEAFTTAETLNDALDVLTGMQIYVELTVSGEGENKSTWTNLISWKRAADLELPL